MTEEKTLRLNDNLGEECKTCDFEKAVHKSRATWLCPNCGRDFSIEYYFWAQAAHPEWFSA